MRDDDEILLAARPSLRHPGATAVASPAPVAVPSISVTPSQAAAAVALSLLRTVNPAATARTRPGVVTNLRFARQGGVAPQPSPQPHPEDDGMLILTRATMGELLEAFEQPEPLSGENATVDV